MDMWPEFWMIENNTSNMKAFYKQQFFSHIFFEQDMEKKLSFIFFYQQTLNSQQGSKIFLKHETL